VRWLIESKPTDRSDRTKDLVLALLVLIAASVLVLSNLGGQYLWQDEAQTALIAGTVLTHGIPLGYDGKNSFSQDGGKDYGRDYIWLWHPWLSFYLLAGFFAVFGKSTLVARLPFALFGVATIVLAYWFGRTLWQSRRAGLFAAAALSINVPYLILARQCRYYAPNMFFALLALYGYWNMTQRRKYATATFTISAILLFHTHYVHYAALIATVIIHALIFHRDRLKTLLIACGVTVIAIAPWIVWFSGMGKVMDSYPDRAFRAICFVANYLIQVRIYVLTPLLVAPPVLWGIHCLLRGKRLGLSADVRERLALILLYIPITVVAVSATSTYPFFRFLAPVIPVAALVIGIILESVAKRRKVAGMIAAIAMLAAQGYMWHMPDYLYEITHRYVGPVDGIVRYLKEHAKKSDVVAITYEDLPIKFYTGLRVVGGLTGEDLNAAKNAEWVIVRKHSICKEGREVSAFLVHKLPLMTAYRPIIIQYPDIPYHNREEPGEHRFRTAKDYPVIIFRKVSSRRQGGP
jgi:4-amino-4-deoxy-L-arabinose transferase-like glycosyltransferase